MMNRSSMMGRNGEAGDNLRQIDWSRESLIRVNKDFYQETSHVRKRDKAKIQRYYDKHDVSVGANSPNPILSFDEGGFSDDLLRSLKKKFEKPTVIQAVSWPSALLGNNLVGIAQTGSGKTLAFLLPAFIHRMSQIDFRQCSANQPQILVLCPTRELAQQVNEVAEEFGRSCGFRSVCVFGGQPKRLQIDQLQRGREALVVVATPGRMLDFLAAGVVHLKKCTYLVLDEADRMLDMGFEPQIRKIFSQVRPDRQILMYSATWPKEVRRLAEEFLQSYLFVNIGSLELAANHNITQNIEIIPEYEKLKTLLEIVHEIGGSDTNAKTLIFMETKRRVDEMTKDVRTNGYAALGIHGDKDQKERDWALDEFRSLRCNILVATDVAARGLDVKNVKYVINCDFPQSTEDYVHRIGRTGRVDKSGYAYTFFTEENARFAPDLIRILEEAKQHVPDELRRLCSLANKSQRGGFGGRGGGRRHNRYGTATSYRTAGNNVGLGSTGGASLFGNRNPPLPPPQVSSFAPQGGYNFDGRPNATQERSTGFRPKSRSPDYKRQRRN